eukprot:CAMPEP_0194216100 /NCGR_PEP_ID=MMETSP0156-20130528/18287_1 /TAXON_ID=33649 /ORGANISM="Thalassionema nitzschioides, Strain L26-B" /LENGTH=460 /DNA_ID=CAMNT_0038944779 /DNA_START=166 /DNA_END=1548 /DNA_ORIENTATION=+
MDLDTGSRSMKLRHANHQPLKQGQYITEVKSITSESTRLNHSELQTANQIKETPSIQQTIHVPEFQPVNIKATWENPKLRPIPKYYPLESSCKAFHENELLQVLSNLSEAFRMLCVQAKYFESPAGAALLTEELVEIYVYLWKTSEKKEIYVELQRRRGDAVTFHRYARSILNAASCGDSLEKIHTLQNESSQYLRSATKLFQRELPTCDDDVSSLQAIELAADLLQKDRLDARILGMESLSVLTNPCKTCWNTARLASRAVLFGSNDHHAFCVIQEFILNIVQNRCMPDEDSMMEGLIDYDSDDDEEEDYFMKGSEEERYREKPSEYYAIMNAFVNYGLKIVANALQVLTTSLDTDKTAEELDPRNIVEQFLQISLEFSPKQDILTTLLIEVGLAESRPHNACLAGKSLKTMSQFSTAARLRTKTLRGFETVSRAEEIGKVTNFRLQEVCGELQQVLAR